MARDKKDTSHCLVASHWVQWWEQERTVREERCAEARCSQWPPTTPAPGSPTTGLTWLCFHIGSAHPCWTQFLPLLSWGSHEDLLHIFKGCIWHWPQSWEATVLHTCLLTRVVKMKFLLGTQDHYCSSHQDTLCSTTDTKCWGVIALDQVLLGREYGNPFVYDTGRLQTANTHIEHPMVTLGLTYFPSRQ